jgi:hypothetical protein
MTAIAAPVCVLEIGRHGILLLLAMKKLHASANKETSFWPEKEWFLNDRKEKIARHLSEVKQLLVPHGFNEEILEPSALVVLRAYHSAQCLLEHAEVKLAFPIDISFTAALPEEIGGYSIPIFSLSDEKNLSGERLFRILDSDKTDKLSVESVGVFLNIGRLKRKMRENVAETDELAMEFEIAIIEEIARACEWGNVCRDKEKFKQAVAEIIGYGLMPQKLRTASEEGDARAVFWKKSYLKKYY